MVKQESPLFFGDWLKRRRQILDLTQEDLAQRSGCSVFAIRKIETGERRPSKQLAGLIAVALEIPQVDQQTFVRVARGEFQLERLPANPLTFAVYLDQPQKTQPGSSPINIPFSPTPLIGRESELVAIERIFQDPRCRLLTLTGPGGIGKTRLAIEFASRQRIHYPGGTYYVPLASIDSPGLIVSAIADSVGFAFSGTVKPKDQLLSFFSKQIKRPVLLILDNMEHLLNQISVNRERYGATDLIVEFLRNLPNTKILVTSRERLNLHGEWTYEIYGLSVPHEGDMNNLLSFGAISLFVESAQRVKVDFELAEDEKQAVVRICQFVEGSPLAIELATAWVGMLTCREIAKEVELNLDLLSSTLRDIPPRHRSIRATFEHSWKLLTDEERSVLTQLSVFQGGFDRYAAAHVVGASLQILASLVSKSLVRPMENRRYDLHELIRQYAASLLAEPEKTAVFDRHSAYYLEFVREREQTLKSSAQQEAVRELMDEIDNVRMAWNWAVERGKIESVELAVRNLGRFFEITGLLQEGIDQFELFTRKYKQKTPKQEWCKVLGLTMCYLGLLYFRKGEFFQAQTLFEECLSFLRPIGDQNFLVDPLVFLGVIMHLNGELEKSRTLLEEGLDCAQVAEDDWFEAYAVFNLGYLSSLMGRYSEGYEQMVDGLEMWRQIGDPQSIALGLNFLSTTLIKMGHFEESKTYLQESIMLCEKTGYRWGLGTAYRYLGLTYMAQGNLKEAQTLLQKSLDIFNGYIIGWDIAISLLYLGETNLQAENLQEAELIFLEALHTSIDAKSAPLALDALAGIAALKMQTGDYDKTVLLSAYVLNHPNSSKDAFDRSYHLIGEAEKKVSTHKIEIAKKKAAAYTLETILTEVELM